MPVEKPAPDVEYYILKDGEMFGSFSRTDLEEGLRRGKFSPGDFVQNGDLPIWRPLINVVGKTEDDLSGAVLPEWKSILRLVWLRLRGSVSQQSIRTGLIFLLISIVSLGISRWPVIFWVPWVVLAGWAGVTLIVRKRELPGTFILLGALAVPVLGAYLAMQSSRQTLARLEAAAATLKASTSASTSPQPATEQAGSGNAPAAESATPLPALAAQTDIPASAESVATTPPAPGPSAPAEGTIAARQTTPPTKELLPWEKPPTAADKMPVAPTPGATPAAENQADLFQNYKDAFVIIQGKEGSGSGFICRAGKQTWLFTNIHVVADMEQPRFTRLDNSPVVPGAAEAASGPDLVRFALPPSAGQFLEVMSDVGTNARIGDEVVVLGNSGGGGVVTSLKGTIQGIGPDRLEVTAEFIPGNSGSPIIHVKTGKVIGIATYLTKRYDQFAPKSAGTPAPSSSEGTGTSGAVVVRRFGYRLDTVARWEPINWAMFRAEAKQLQQVSELTKDIIGFLGSLRGKTGYNYSTETLRRPAMNWLARARNKQVSENDRYSATQTFLGQLRSMVRSDIQMVDPRIRYTYFRNDLRDEQQTREQLYEAFNSESSAMASTVGRAGYR